MCEGVLWPATPFHTDTDYIDCWPLSPPLPPPPPSFLSAPAPPLRLTFFLGEGGGGVQITKSVQVEGSRGTLSCPFLDDVCLLCDPSRVKVLYELLEEALSRVAYIQLHQGKTRAWNRAGIPPEATEELGEDVWQPAGITVLGKPWGRSSTSRRRWKNALWEAIPTVPDLQCAWQILLQSHDEGIWATGKVLLDGLPAADSRDRESSTGHASDADGRSRVLVATGVG